MREERGDRTGLADRRPARLNERVPGAVRPLLGDVAVVGRRGAGLPDLRIQAEIGGQLAPIREAVDVTDGGHDKRASRAADHRPQDLRFDSLVRRASASLASLQTPSPQP